MHLLEAFGGFLRTQALHTVARLGVADLVGGSRFGLTRSPPASTPTRRRCIA